MFRRKRRARADSAGEAASSAGDAARQAASRTQDAYASNPLIGGLIAAAVGSIVGTAAPLTETEDQQLAGLGDAAREKLGEQKDRLVSAARKKKDELVGEAQNAAQPSTA